MKWKSRNILLGIIVLGLMAALIFTWHVFYKNKEEPPVSLIASKNGTIVKLSKHAAEKSGIKLSKLAPASLPKTYEAYGKILLPQLLIDARNRFIQAKAQSQKAFAQLNASSKEYDRIKKLSKNQDVSTKMLQSSEAIWLSDSATLLAAENSLQAERDSLHAQWGSLISDWITGGSAEYIAIVQSQKLLLHITLPQGVPLIFPPLHTSIKINDKTVLHPQFIAAAPQTDEQIQGLSFYFLLPSTTYLLPGMSIAALLPTTPPIQGVIAPLSAIVWWQGQPWIYVENAPREYQRIAIDTEVPRNNGFLIHEVNSQQSVVTEGAQVLLSQEILGTKTPIPD